MSEFDLWKLLSFFKSTAPENTTKSLSGEKPKNDNPVYTVKKGDTLFSVAKANGVSVEDLKKSKRFKR